MRSVPAVYKVVGQNLVCDHAFNRMKAIEQYFHVVLFIMLHKFVLSLNSLNETLVYGQ